MERTLSVEERIRRAEEIYSRRNGTNYYTTYSNKSREKKSPSLRRRLLKQIIVCSLIYCVFYVVSNKEYYLSQDFQNKIQEIVSQNSILNSTYNYIIGYVEKFLINQNDVEESITNEETMNKESLDTEEEEKQQKKEQPQENIGGVEETEEPQIEKTVEEQDIEYIKNKINFILPIEGSISSTFGWRNPTTSTVPKYHTGLDIAATTGTVIKSATDGKIVLASNQGDYGNHYKIQINDIILIYAHCNKLYFKEGDTVIQGQEIAEVGSTGNSTGPHLHFEIRRENRLIDPQSILNI